MSVELHIGKNARTRRCRCNQTRNDQGSDPSETAKEAAPTGKARMHTCLDQYHANKVNNANGDLKWIVKGGGYYSECNKRLKG
jgi:hypothetical protein